MTIRFLTAASILALVSACSSQPGPSSLSATEQGYNAWRAGNYAAAEAAYGSALAANRGNETAMLGLAEVYESTGRISEAAALYREVRAARSGAIRVYNDGRPMQDGVTETATRRLGALGHSAPATFEAPMVHAPVTHAPVFQAPMIHQPTVTHTTTHHTTTHAAPAPKNYWPEDPVYKLGDDGTVYYADPAATQPIRETLYATPEAATMRSVAPAPAYQSFEQPAPRMISAPVTTYAPAPMQAAPISYTPAPMPVQPAPMTYEPAPMTYEAAPMVQPAAPRYTTAPAMPAPTYATAPVSAPLPTRQINPVAPAASGAVGQPGYAVVNGNFVYVSAEDIANGATAPTPTPAGPAAEGYGVPTPVSSSGIPFGTPSTYSAPRGVDVINGLSIPNLN